MSNKGQKKEKEQVIDTVRLKPAGQVQLVPTKEPSPPPSDKRIHQRRPLPLVPEALPNDDEEKLKKSRLPN